MKGKERTVQDLASTIKEAEKDNIKPIFFIGAGFSATAGIPVASELAKEILKQFQRIPKIQTSTDKSYSALMELIDLPVKRNEFLKPFMDEAKINVSHIYLANLFKHNFVHQVMTTNFDDLMLQALALYNIFPPVFDMAIYKDLTTSHFDPQSVVYLHGQYKGIWLLNNQLEMEEIKERVRTILSQASARPWIVVGYSGSDPVFECIEKLGRFDHGIYWVFHGDEEPNKEVKKFLTENDGVFFIREDDADTFMVKLHQELKLDQPQILAKPFSLLKEMLGNIKDIENKEQFAGVSERLESAKKNVAKAIQIFENKEKVEIKPAEQKINKIKTKIINIILSGKFEAKAIQELKHEVEQQSDLKLKELLASLYYNWGYALGKLLELKEGDEKEKLLKEAMDKFKEAVKLKQDYYQAYHNWGVVLVKLSELKEGDEKEKLLKEVIDKFKEAVKLKQDFHASYHSWGLALDKLSKLKEGDEKEKLLKEAMDKFKEAVKLKQDYPEAYYNWGVVLVKLSELKEGDEKEKLLKEAMDKFKEAVKLKQDYPEAYYNWGNALDKLSELEGDEKEKLLKKAMDKYKEAVKIKQDYHASYHSWGVALGKLSELKEGDEKEKLLEEAIGKFKEVVKLKEDDYKAYNNYGFTLFKLSELKEGDEKEELLKGAISKYEKTVRIKEDYPEAYTNWGGALFKLSELKEGDEKEKLLKKAMDKFKEAVKLKQDYHEAYYNWGVVLGTLSDIKEGDEKEKLLKEAMDKFKEAVKLKQDYPKAYNSWGLALVKLTQLKSGKEAEELYQQAEEVLKKGIQYGGGHYNYACVLALTDRKAEALRQLGISLTNQEITLEHVLNDSDWKSLANDPDFKALIEKHSP